LAAVGHPEIPAQPTPAVHSPNEKRSIELFIVLVFGQSSKTRGLVSDRFLAGPVLFSERQSPKLPFY
jgi:hypothetical protein